MVKKRAKKQIEDLPKFGNENPPSMEELAEMLSNGLVQIASHRSFDLFRNRKFRRAINFSKLDQGEQDRIFNELVATTLVLVMMTLEAPDLRVVPDFKEYLRGLKDEIPKAHLDQLKNLGIKREYRRQWEKLIKMRYKEYQEKRLDVRSAAMELESAERGEVSGESMSQIQIALPVNTLAIGTHLHVTRGKGDPKDPLFRLLLKWLVRVYTEVRLTVEGGKISFWNRIVAKVYAFLESLKF